MNKTIKTLSTIALVSVVASSAMFAAPTRRAIIEQKPVIETVERKMEHKVETPKKEHFKIQTLTGTIKTSKDGFILFETKDKQTYVVNTAKNNANHNSEDVSIKSIKSRNGKKLILSGFLNEETKVFTVVKIGGMNHNNNNSK